MATITNAVTVSAVSHAGTTRFLFRYTFDNGEVHEARAWVPVGTNEAAERDRRAAILIDELAKAEVLRVLE